ncbi:hypothetical protein DYB32_001696 [Aphanomyces invadans]|uniref:RIO kinase domain-containing protein n=1 Tax=Aphanomyces invadans TaxID=157072 RepID=A0A3R6WRP0_9STRA|nr:hypothetical protein DYB32_001696 [Aphanomyces invadans]
MKLDVSGMRYLTKEHFKVLTAVELGMKNHEIVPVELISSIAKLRHGGVAKILSHLLRNKLIAHDGTTYDGFKLTYMGYDFLALKVFMKHGHIAGLGRQIGVGKESDIYMAVQPDGTEVAIKFHRLGRTSFRAVKNVRVQKLFNRDVHGLVKFFSRLQNGAYVPDEVPQLSDIVRDVTVSLDTEVQASGYTEAMAQELDQVIMEGMEEGGDDESGDDNGELDDDEGDEEEIDPTLAKELHERIDALKNRHDEPAAPGGSGGDESDDENEMGEDEVDGCHTTGHNEHVRKQVKKTLTKQQQKGGTRRTRNSSKLSIKGKLVHRRDAL